MLMYTLLVFTTVTNDNEVFERHSEYSNTIDNESIFKRISAPAPTSSYQISLLLCTFSDLLKRFL